MQATLYTENARLIPKGKGYALQAPRSILGIGYWKTLKRYSSLEDFKKNYRIKK